MYPYFQLQIRNINRVIFNNQDKYNEKRKTENDIVILKLSSPLEFDQHTKPICLPKSKSYEPENQNNVQCYVSGWGKMFGKLPTIYGSNPNPKYESGF